MLFRCLLSLITLPLAFISAQRTDDELGAAAELFSGPIEVVSSPEEFSWLESPLWSDAGNYLLFSDVKWADANGITCGMLWKYDETNGATKFLECSGLVGPDDPPDNIVDYVEAGSNGLTWGWQGDGDLLMCQHGKSRIIRINVNDVVNGTINPNLVTVLVDRYNGTIMNSPNDMFLDDQDTLYFTDPPFGLQFLSVDNPPSHAFAIMPQEAAVYKLQGDPGNKVPAEPTRILSYGRPTDPWEGPNGIALNVNGDLIIPVTTLEDPRMEVFAYNEETDMFVEPPTKITTDFRIQGEKSDLPQVADGVTLWKRGPDDAIIFLSGPGGVYIYNATDYDLLGFLRIDDLNANNAVGGGYLWMTANQRLLRIPLATASTVSPPTDESPTPLGPSEESPPTDSNDSSSAPSVVASFSVLVAIVLVFIGLNK